MKHAQSELIRLAAEMALAKGMPSPYLEDHAFYVSTPMAEQSTPERWMKWCDSKALDKIDELRGDLAAAERGHDAAHAACVKYDAELAALKEAARKVTCKACGPRVQHYYALSPCPDCADLRAILEKQP